MLTISQLAAFAGVTVKAIRHYHARGLLAEPERDASGYRRYGAAAAIELIRIKTLADAGVPLARVGELLQADEARFATAVDEIDHNLRTTIRRLQQHRRRVRQLTNGDALTLPPVVVDYLALLRRLGLSERMIAVERDGWLLLCAHTPERVPEWIRTKADSLENPAYLRAYQLLDQTWDWSPDDPRLPGIADAMLAADVDELTADDSATRRPDECDDTIVALLDAQTVGPVPAWRRLSRLLVERGLVVGTDLRHDEQHAPPDGSSGSG